MSSISTPLSPGEMSLLSTLLALLAEQFSYKSCTDYPLDATTENKALAAVAIEHAGTSGDWGDDEATWEDYVADVMDEEDQFVTFMDWMAHYLAVRCQALAAGTGTPVNGAERTVIVELLGVGIEDHDEAEAMDLVPYALEADDANRAVLARISPEKTRPPGQATSVPLKAILMYFSERLASA